MGVTVKVIEIWLTFSLKNMLSKLSASRQIVSSGHLAKKIQPSLFLNKRFFATNESQITPNSTEYENTQERKDLKRSIAKKSPTFMRLWYALGVAGIVGATMYYMNGIKLTKT